MIKIKEKTKPKDKITPYYSLKIKYMIGDANGNINEKGIYDLKYADQIEMFCKILDKMKPLEGTWGIVLEDFSRWYNENQISLEEYLFLQIVGGSNFLEYYDYNIKKVIKKDFKQEEQEIINKYVDYEGLFEDLIFSENEYSFLVYEGYELKYVDEDGVKHKTFFE